MRDLLRLIVVAAMSFAVVGIAMVYSRGGDLGQTMRAMGNGLSGVVTDVSSSVGLGQSAGASATASEPAAPTSYTISMPRPNAAHWAGLAGFPDQSEVTFALPKGQSLLTGGLNLVFDTELAEHGDGLMTLSVNGTARGQLVLNAGRAQHQVRIELTPADMAGDRIVLHMAGRGNTNSGQICPTDAANSGAAVTLSADSRLELTSDQPLADAVQALVIAPKPLVLRPGALSGDTALAIWANQQFRRSGIDARIGEPGAGETGVTVSSAAVVAAGVAADNILTSKSAVDQVIAASGSAPALPVAWPVSVADLGAETIVKSFRGSRRWTVAFNAADLPGGALPELFQLRLKTTPLAGNNEWVVRISLNGNLIETRRIAGHADSIAYDVALPVERLLPANALVVELVDTTPNEGICTRGPDAQAQLQPESALLDQDAASAPWAELIEALARAANIRIDTATGLSAAQAEQASASLSLLLPRNAAVKFDLDSALRLAIVTRAGMGAWLAEQGPGAAVSAILPSGLTGQAPRVIGVPSAEFGAALERLGAEDVLILVAGL